MNYSLIGTLSASTLLAISLSLTPVTASADIAISYYSGDNYSRGHNHIYDRRVIHSHAPVIHSHRPYYGWGAYNPPHVDQRYRKDRHYKDSHDRHRKYSHSRDHRSPKYYSGHSRFDDYRSRRFKRYYD